MNVQVLDNGLHAPDGALQYAWFRLSTPQGERFRCIALRELSSIPISSRDDYDLLGKQWAACRGLYNAGVDFLYSAAGIFTPDHIGIVQYYGAAAQDASLDAAARLAQGQVSAVVATLAASYPQSVTRAPSLNFVEWYVDFIAHRAQHVIALLGHPDPRETRRGLGKDGELPNNTGDDLAAEQNELLFRGLAKLREDFIIQVTAEHMSRRGLANALVRVAQVASNVASRRRGALSIGFSIGIPLMAAISNSLGGGVSRADSQAHSQGDTQSHGWGQSHTDSSSHTDSQSHSWGESVSKGVAVSHGTSEADSTNWSHTDGRAHTDSQAHTTSQSHTDSQSTTQSSSTSQGVTQTSGQSSNWSQSDSSNWSQGAGVSQSSSVTDSQNTSLNASVNGSVSANGSIGVTDLSPITGSIGGGVSVGGSVGASVGTGTSVQTGQSTSVNTGVGGGTTSSVGGGTSSSTSVSSSTTQGTATTQGSADTYGTADTVGSADTVSSADSVGGGHAVGVSDSVTQSRTVSKSWANTVGSADSQGVADGKSESWGDAHSQSDALGVAIGRSGMQGLSGGFSAGLAPSISLGRSWQTEDDVADRVTEVLRQFEALLNVASGEGGFMTDALLFTASETGVKAAEALVPQAFHGPNVPTPVLTVRPDGSDAGFLREHAWAFLPYGAPDPGDPFDGMLWSKYATLLTAGQVAAYSAPGLIEEGTAVTVMPPIPQDMGFIPQMPGDVVLGHQVSPTTRDLTAAAVKLDPSRLMHTMFAGDTGFGKSVAAIRMAYETTVNWQLRTVVLDFGAGWRQLLNAQGLEGHVDILQLWPNAVRPLRWNPLQIGRNIDPETQWRAFADIFGSIAHLGVRRQKQELLEALRQVYIRAGVLVDDPDVRQDPEWGKVRGSEEARLTGKTAGTVLDQLTPQQRQRLAVLRSTRVGLKNLSDEIKARLADVPPRDAMLAGVLEGIVFRLNPLVQGAASAQFAPGDDVIAIEDLGKPWGIAIIEGGMFLDDFGKAFLLGWIGWHLYTDMVARRVHEVKDGEPLLQIFFEEANKIFSGAESGGGEDEGGGVSASQRFGDMFRDARKYKARLHVITQAPHMLPDDIISSCNNLVIAFLKNPKDKDLVLSALARSEKGFRDEEWRRFVSDIPIGMSIGRFPYTTTRELQRAFLFRPLLLDVREPSDAEIGQKLQGKPLRRAAI